MKRFATFDTGWNLKNALAATAVFVVSGCQAIELPSVPNFNGQVGPSPQLPPAELPTYHPGDKFYYSNGARDQVVRVDGEMVDMISRSGRKRTYFRNFALPTPYIEGVAKEYFKTTNTRTNALWPLQPENKARFTTNGRSVSKDSGRTNEYIQKWSCAVNGTERIRVLAGEFDTFRVECKRYSISGRWWENTTWYYAPEVGSYVMRRKFHKKRGESIRQLTAVRPSLQGEPDSVRRNIVRTWQSALEYRESGQIESWTDKATGTSVQVEPLQTYRAQNGLFCRTYKQYLTRQGDTRIYRGVACRTGKLRWRTPSRV